MRSATRLRMVSFRVDDETFDAIKQLESEIGNGVVTKNKKSIAIRKALLEARDRIRRSSKNQ